MIGTKLAHFTITAHLGSGGMGDVYQATDSKLGRSVAIKLLPEAFIHDTERAARFEREARVLASLNHPNIAAIHGIEESGGQKFLVMELVPGETLADRIKRGSIPVDEALSIATKIAEALESAHEKGIVHRDLKPANIKVAPDGNVKVLDFGLAKVFEGKVAAASLSNSPTMMSMGTSAGMILGTAAYMSPEQARGQNVDRRTDIFAFGAVLFEMLSGRPAFAGEAVGDILAAVIRGEPDWGRLPGDTPLGIRRLLRRCLQKDRNHRLHTAADVRIEIEEVGTETEVGAVAPHPSRWRERVAWIAAAIMMAGLAVLATVHFRSTPTLEDPVLQFSIPAPENSTLSFLEISPDGRRLLVVANLDGKRQIYLRSLDSPELQPLSGTEGVRTPFWSPDSRFIGFFADGKLKVIPAVGGPARMLCSETGPGGGGTWSRNGVILFGGPGPLLRVDEAGGMCAVVGKDDPEKSTGFPVFLPDGNHFFYIGATQGDDSSRGVYLAALDDLTPRKILADYSSVLYSPSVAGRLAHLLFLRETTLMAQPFDELELKTVGDPFPVALQATAALAATQVAASVANGTLVYVARRSTVSQFTWFDRSGKELGQVGPRADQMGVVLSPDGNAVLTRRVETNGQRASWLYDLSQGLESRFVSSDMQPGVAAWFPEGRRVLFGMTGPAGLGLYQKEANGGGQAELVLPTAASGQSPSNQGIGISVIPSAVSWDGRFLVYTVNDPKTQADIWYVPWDGKPDLTKAEKFLATQSDESQGQLSPDGKWIAYWSDETDSAGEVYIRPFPTGPGEWRVSVDGGQEPRWSADSKQLYYVRALNTERGILYAAAVQSDGQVGLRTGTPQKLFEIHRYNIHPRANVFGYSPHPDGRFLVNTLVEAGEPTINVITNWQKAVADKSTSDER